VAARETPTAARYLDIEMEGSNGVVRMQLSGELDMLTAPLLIDALERLRVPGRRVLVVDLTELRFMDRAGLAALSAAANDRTRRMTVAVTGCRPNVRRVFELTGHEEMISRTGLAALTTVEAGDEDTSSPEIGRGREAGSG
jgi:anti-sigma B factor antagonist